MIAPRASLDRRPEVLPPELLPLFDDTFVRSCDLYEAYVGRLTVDVLTAVGAWEHLRDGASADELVQRCGLQARTPFVWLLRHLVDNGALLVDEGDGGPRYRLADRPSTDDTDRLRILQEGHDPAALPSYDIAAAAAAAYPAVLRGETSGERVLLGPQTLGLWTAFFSNDNPLYAINNAVGALAATAWCPRPVGRVVEIGGGLGSAALALLGALDGAGRLDEVEQYRFTDVAPVFLRRGQRAVAGRYGESVPLAFGALDMDRDLREQGLDDGPWSLVWAVNTLHVAHDLDASLERIHALLDPGGMLLLSECVRPFADRTVYTEFVFNLLESFHSPLLHPERRPQGGFLSPEQWRAALDHAGFAEVRFLPDVTAVRELFPSFVVGAVGAVKG